MGSGWVPTRRQFLLLKACLAPQQEAEAALAAWRAGGNEAEDAGSRRLLPLLWKRWAGIGRHQLPPAWKDDYLRSWRRGQLAVARTNQLGQLFAAAAIPTLLIKGVPLALEAYADLGSRPMADIDLVVPFEQARTAVELLLQAGWRPAPTPLKGGGQASVPPSGAWLNQPRSLERFDPCYLRVRHSHGFHHPDGTEIDLHWFLFEGQCDPGSDDGPWQRASGLAARCRIQQVHPLASLLSLGRADHLLLLLAHGERWNPVPPIRWISDAVLLLRAPGALDWSCFVAEALRRGLATTALAMLRWLEQAFRVGVPATVLQKLTGAGSPGQERQLVRRAGQGPGWGSGLEELFYLRSRHRRLRREAVGGENVPPFPRFVCDILGAPDTGSVMRYASSELARRWHRQG
jgi:hypothetical protein